MLPETQTKNEETVFLDDSFQDKFIGQFENLTFQSCFNHCMKKFLTKRLTNMGFCSHGPFVK